MRPAGGFDERDVHRDEVGAAGELEQPDGLGAAVAHASLVGVVGEDCEVEPARLARQRLPDRAEADDPERAARHAAGRQPGREAPVASAHRAVVGHDPAGVGQQHRQHVLGHLVGAVDGDVGDRDAAPRRLVDGDVVGADAVAADDAEPLAGGDDRRRDVGEAGEDRVGVAHQLDELVLLTGLGEHGRRVDRGEHLVLDRRVGPADVGDQDLHAGCSSASAARPAYASAPSCLLDAQELVVLGEALRLGDRADLDLPAGGADREVGQSRVLGFAGPRGDDGAIPRGLRPLHHRERLADGADLVHLHEHRIGRAARDPAFEAFEVGGEEVVADDLQAVAERGGQLRPALPVVLGQRVLDRQHRVPVGQLAEHGRELLRGAGAALGGEHIAAAARVVEVRGGDVERVSDVIADAQARALDGGVEQLQRRCVRFERRPEAALVRLEHREAALAQHVGGRLIDRDDHPQRLAVAVGADRHHQEVLEVELAAGVQPAADDVHHRHRQQGLGVAGEVAPERHARRRRPRRARRRARRRGWRWRRGATCPACRRAR